MELLKNNKRIFPLIGAIIVFILSFSVLYMGDNIGLSDNGDFRRVLLVIIWNMKTTAIIIICSNRIIR